MSTAKKSPARKPSGKIEPFVYKGITVGIERNPYDDTELIDWMADYQDGNFLLGPRIYRRVVGDEKYQEIMDALRNKHGIVPVSATRDFFDRLGEWISPNLERLSGFGDTTETS